MLPDKTARLFLRSCSMFSHMDAAGFIPRPGDDRRRRRIPAKSRSSFCICSFARGAPRLPSGKRPQVWIKLRDITDSHRRGRTYL